MESKPHDQLILDFTPAALSDLDVIWDWNARKYGRDHADRYIEFLQRQTDKLRKCFLGQPVPTRPNFRYLVIRRRRKGHGHVVVYEIVENRLRVLRYFHTSQNWQENLSEKE